MNKEYIEELKKKVGDKRIIAATKYLDSSESRLLYSYGIKDFGENKALSLIEKKKDLKDLDITWHFIGHLQRNKVKKVINEIDYLHSLDSIELAELIDKERTKPLKVFVELKLTESETKTGVKESELDSLINRIKELKNIELIGFMAMSEKTYTIDETREVFKKAHSILNKYNLKELSMGMSNDYLVALECGATMVRLGRILYKEDELKNEI